MHDRPDLKIVVVLGHQNFAIVLVVHHGPSFAVNFTIPLGILPGDSLH